jgi:hypothetical protein
MGTTTEVPSTLLITTILAAFAKQDPSLTVMTDKRTTNADKFYPAS